MDDRSKLFVSRVRKRLRDADYQKVLKEEIYDSANLIQTQIMLKTNATEKIFNINFKNGINKYDFTDEGRLNIIKFVPSWDGEVIYVLPREFEKYKDYSTQGGNIYLTIFSNAAYIYPQAWNSTDKIDIWALQREVITPMDDDIGPELPVICDMALVFGTIADIAPGLSEPKTGIAYYQLFEEQIKLINSRGLAPSSVPAEFTPDW